MHNEREENTYLNLSLFFSSDEELTQDTYQNTCGILCVCEIKWKVKEEA